MAASTGGAAPDPNLEQAFESATEIRINHDRVGKNVLVFADSNEVLWLKDLEDGEKVVNQIKGVAEATGALFDQEQSRLTPINNFHLHRR